MLQKTQDKFHKYVTTLQDLITDKMKEYDPALKMTEDNWKRKDFSGNEGGGGRTRAFEGEVFENAGVNTSLIYGKVDPKFSKSVGGQTDEIWATGISLILHPKNPRVPTVHANFRMIVSGEKFWFGGGADLTPYYPHEEDFHYFHKIWKDALPQQTHTEMKDYCDRYFTNHHRNGEMRGIGGIFFDHLNSNDLEKDFKLVTGLGDQFINSYFPILEKRYKEEYTKEDEEFQLYRHGRYVEFNLLHDRGTHFGLKSNGRVESILISLPKRVQFGYSYAPPKGSVHEKMMENYFPKNWGTL